MTDKPKYDGSQVSFTVAGKEMNGLGWEDGGRVKKRTLTIEVPEEWARLLEVIGTVEVVVAELIDHAQQGVSRPGAWERGWLEQAFGTDWQQKLKTYPEAPKR